MLCTHNATNAMPALQAATLTSRGTPSTWPASAPGAHHAHPRNKSAGRIIQFLALGFWDNKTPRYAPAPCHIAGIYQPLPGSRPSKLLTRHDSACCCIVSVVTCALAVSRTALEHTLYQCFEDYPKFKCDGRRITFESFLIADLRFCL